MPQFAFIMPDDRTKGEMRAVERLTKDMRPDQIERVFHLIKSWGIGQGSYAEQFLGGMRRAIRKVRNNHP